VIARGGGWHLPRTLRLVTTSGAVHLEAVAFSSPALGREAWWPAARECRGAAALPRVAGLAGLRRSRSCTMLPECVVGGGIAQPTGAAGVVASWRTCRVVSSWW
jgi:hypothetical protein